MFNLKPLIAQLTKIKKELSPRKIITVEIADFWINSVEGLPEGYEIHFKDFDGTDGAEDLPVDEDGDPYWLTVYRVEEWIKQ